MSSDLRRIAGRPAAGPETVGDRLRTARARLAGAQKPNAAVPAYLRYVNRRAGGWLACLGYALRVTPTQVSMSSAAVSTAALIVVAAAPATAGVGVGVAVALALAYALDSADGQLARVRGGGTPAGEWIDHVLDIAKTVVLHGCVLITLYRNFDVGDWSLLIPLLFLLAQVTNFFGNMLRDALRLQAGLARQPSSAHASPLSAVVLLPVDHGTLCWSFALLGWHAGYLAVYTALCAVATAFAGRALLRAFRGLSALDAGSPV